MPSLSDIPSSLNRKKLIRALERLNFVINTKGGDGSHIKIIWPKNNKSVTCPDKFQKQTILYIVKEIEKISGITFEDIKKKL